MTRVMKYTRLKSDQTSIEMTFRENFTLVDFEICYGPNLYECYNFISCPGTSIWTLITSKLDENATSYIPLDAPRAALQNSICDFSIQGGSPYPTGSFLYTSHNNCTWIFFT